MMDTGRKDGQRRLVFTCPADKKEAVAILEALALHQRYQVEDLGAFLQFEDEATRDDAHERIVEFLTVQQEGADNEVLDRGTATTTAQDVEDALETALGWYGSTHPGNLTTDRFADVGLPGEGLLVCVYGRIFTVRIKPSIYVRR